MSISVTHTTPADATFSPTGQAAWDAAHAVSGAAASGANSDITSLSGLITALSLAQGGTGNTTTPGAGQIIFSDGSKLVGDANLTWDATNGLTDGKDLFVNTSNSTASIRIGALPGFAASYAGLWLAQSSPDSTNYTFLVGTPLIDNGTFLNAAFGGHIHFKIGNVLQLALVDAIGATFTYGATFNSNVLVGSSAAVQALYFTDPANNIAYLQTDTDSTHAWSLNGRTATKVPLLVVGTASQSANLQEWKNSGSSNKLFLTATGSLVVGSAALATNATDGFFYIPTSAGAPTGTPTAQTGTVAAEYDTTNDALQLYNGAWKTCPTQATGSWTPADNSGAALSFTGVSASYTKIGNMIFAYAAWTYPVTASGANASISGLPFASANANYAQVPSVVDTSASITGGLVAVPVKNTTTLNFDVGTPFGPATNLQLSTASVAVMLIYPAV